MDFSVRIFHCKLTLLLPVIAAVVIICVIPFQPINADDMSQVHKTSKNAKKVHFTANRLVSDNGAGLVELNGDVHITQGKTIIHADTFLVYYSKEMMPEKDRHDPGSEAIEKVVATGNVYIRFDDIVANTQRAVYTKMNQTVILAGDGTKTMKGKHSITGSAITYFMDKKQIKIERGKGKQIRAIVFPEK